MMECVLKYSDTERKIVLMKTAYSLFLREHIDPKNIDYEDCRTD
jgi:hypothetical protein